MIMFGIPFMMLKITCIGTSITYTITCSFSTCSYCFCLQVVVVFLMDLSRHIYTKQLHALNGRNHLV